MSSEFEPRPSAMPLMAEEAAGPYWRAVTRHWLLVVLVTALAIGVAVFTVSRRTSTYQASASVLISPLPQTNQDFVGTGAIIDSSDPARTVQTAAALLNSPEAASAAARALGAGWNQQRVARAVNVTPRGQSDVLAVTAQAPTAAQSRRLANEFAQAAVAARSRIVQQNIAGELRVLRARQIHVPSAALSPEQQALGARINGLQAVQDSGRDPTLSVSQPAQLPGSPTGAPGWLIVVLAALAGLALAGVAALAIDYFSRRIRDEHDTSALFPVPILAGIPKVGRSRGVLSPMSLPPVAFEQLRLLRAQLMAHRNAQVVMITSADAGDGKTTVAAALAGAFGEGERDVILLDLDVIKPDLAPALGLEQPLGHDHEPMGGQIGSNSDDTLDKKARRNGEPSLAELLVPVPGLARVKVLPAQRGDMSMLESLIGRLPDLLDEATQLADWVIIDTAPVGEVSHSLRIAPAADAVVVVVRPRHTDRSRLVLARDMLLRGGANVVGTVLVGQSIAKVGGPYYAYGATSTQGGEKPFQRLLRTGKR